MKKLFLTFLSFLLTYIYAMEDEKIEKALTPLKLNKVFGKTILKYVHQNPFTQEARDEIEKYLNLGADINYKIKYFERTALNYAVRNSNKELFNFLLQKSADINIPDNIETSPLYFALTNQLACFDIEEDFLKRGADPSITKEGAPLLHAAAKFGTNDSIKLLIEYGAEIDGKNFLDRTALNEALVYKKFEAIEQLCNFGASIININSRDSAFHVAIQQKLPKNYINLLITNSRLDTHNKKIDEQLKTIVKTVLLTFNRLNNKRKIFNVTQIPQEIQFIILSYLALDYFYGFNKKLCQKLVKIDNKNIRNPLIIYTLNKVNSFEEILGKSKNENNKTALQLLYNKYKDDQYIQEVESLVNVKTLQQDRIDFMNGLTREDNLVTQIYEHSKKLLLEK